MGILFHVLFPVVQQGRGAARRSQCANNLRQIGLALANYESQYKVYPPGQVNLLYSANSSFGPSGFRWAWPFEGTTSQIGFTGSLNSLGRPPAVIHQDRPRARLHPSSSM